MTQQKPTSKPPPTTEEEIEEAKKKLDDACAQAEASSKKHAQAAEGLKRTISNPKLQAVKLPTPSQLELEAVEPPPKQ